MKQTTYSKNAALNKAFLMLLLILNIPVFAQTPAKWSVAGNTAASADYIGTNNSEDFIIKTNGTTAVKVKANGNILFKSLDSQGTGIVTFDNNGKLLTLPFTGDISKVLFADGSWGTLPTSQWQNNGTKIYYNGGKVGIGTSTPNYKLDVDGDVRITQNLYLQGGMIISDKQVKSKSLKTDSILVDSSAFYGTAKFTGPVKLQSRLDVSGDAKIDGNFTVYGSLATNGSLSFAGGREISYTPAFGGHPAALGWGVPATAVSSVMGLAYCLAPNTTGANVFAGMTYSYGTNGSGLMNVMRSGFDGENGIIDMAGLSNTGQPRLLLNYYCGSAVDICTGVNGGDVHLTMLGKVGIGTDNPAEKLDVAGNIRLNSNTLFLKNDTYHGLKYTTSFAGATMDGVALFGYTNGVLGTTGLTGEKTVLFWNSDGKVGIGNTNPQAQLDVTGDMRIGSLSGSGNNVVQVDNNGKLSLMPLATAGVGFWQTYDGGNQIFHNTGNVGIGNDAPADLLQVGNGASRLVSGNAGGADLNYGTSYIGFNADRNASGKWTFKTDSQHNGGAVMYANVFGDMYFSTTTNNAGTADQTKTDSAVQASTKLFIASDGNVAIGTLHPDGYKLSVNGTMRAKDITVKLTGWSDFVFDENYTRMSILDKETYYKKEKHLPNINCANEIVNNGLQVGTTMNGMMQNIEENTLDLADLYKKFLTLEKENAELKQKNIEIQQRVIELEKASQ